MPSCTLRKFRHDGLKPFWRCTSGRSNVSGKKRHYRKSNRSGQKRRYSNSNGSVRETVIYFYGEDQRAARAAPGQPLRREAVYQGHAHPLRLHAARKLSDTYHVGPAGHERRDRTVIYHADGRVARTVVYYYDGETRAATLPDSSPD